MTKYRIKATPLLGESFISEKMSKEEAEANFDEMVESGLYESVKIKKVEKKKDDNSKKIAESTAKHSMIESAMEILGQHKKNLEG